MTQVYHSNATTNQHQRKIIQQSSCANTELAERFGINVKTVAKHKARDCTKDKSSRPKVIHYWNCYTKPTQRNEIISPL